MRLNIEEFDYPFDPELIALYPSEKREQARLMILKRGSRRIEHRRFFEAGRYLEKGDVLVLNNTRVIPARLSGKKRETGGRVEILLIRRVEGDIWEIMAKGRLRQGIRVDISPSCWCEIVEKNEEKMLAAFHYRGKWEDVLQEVGRVPLPPYINRLPENKDSEWYQTVYALQNGSIAAPTAGLHFSPELLQELERKGVRIAYITLHIGPGTFRPVRVRWIDEHRMDHEIYEVGEDTVAVIKKARDSGNRIIAVGTTTVKALEQTAIKGEIEPSSGSSSLFIYPGFEFKIIDGMITNFHLPRSTLLMLVSAFAGKDFIKNAYEEAVRQRYRFYSYGDAMMII